MTFREMLVFITIICMIPSFMYVWNGLMDLIDFFIGFFQWRKEKYRNDL